MSGTVHQLSLRHARRIAVRAQLLAAERPTDAMDVARQLGLLQLDQTNAVAPSAHLVLWSRLGEAAYDPVELDDALARQQLVDLDGMARPAADLAMHRALMAVWPRHDWQGGALAWVQDNAAFRADVLQLLREDGPLPSAQIPDGAVVPWRSSGWNNHRNVVRMLDVLVARGEVAVSGREGRERLWDLAERVYRPDPVPPLPEALRRLDARRLTALGIARARAPKTPNEPDDVGEAGEPARIDGVRGQWRVDPAQLDRSFAGRTALLSPLDRLVFDRRRMAELFGFDYQLEMYKPAAKRRWGYWAMPILDGDRLVGKLDAKADREVGVLRVNAVHEDEPFSRARVARVDREIRDLARFLQLDLLRG